MPHILYKFATRSRPLKFRALIENIVQLTHHEDYTILVSIDEDDETMLNTDTLNLPIVLRVGNSKNKIDAINRDLPYNDWDILVNVSDDMWFTKYGFDIDIIEAFENNLDQYIHFPDGFTNERLCSMSIIGREYYERFGYIYHPDYVSLWCDNESMEVAQMLGKYKYVNKNIFVHNHPVWLNQPQDELLRKTQSFERQDKRVYNKRKACGFPNHSIL